MSPLRNPHPGEILKEEFLNEIGLSQNQLAHAIGVPPNRIHARARGGTAEASQRAQSVPAFYRMFNSRPAGG